MPRRRPLRVREMPVVMFTIFVLVVSIVLSVVRGDRDRRPGGARASPVERKLCGMWKRLEDTTAPRVILALLITASMCCRRVHADDPASATSVFDLYDRYRQSFPDVPEITVEDLSALDPDSVWIVDVRPLAERRVSSIPGAIAKDGLFDSLAVHGVDAGDARVVTYCTIGYRSAIYARELRARGIDAASLRGSILGWIHAGQPIVDSVGVTKRVHVYGSRWNLVPAGYEAVW